MHATYQFSLHKDLVSGLHPCPDCGARAEVFFENDQTNPSTAKPFVFIQCLACTYRISSADLLCDLTGVAALDKCNRVISLWNQHAASVIV